MKIQVLTATAVLAFIATSSVIADDNLKVTNDSTRAVAIGGNGSFGGAWGAGGASFDNHRALAGSVLVSGCNCDNDDLTIENTSVNSLAVGHAISGSIVHR